MPTGQITFTLKGFFNNQPACAQANALRLKKIMGFCGFSGSQKRVAFALPEKRWNAGLRQNDAKQMRLGAKALWGV